MIKPPRNTMMQSSREEAVIKRPAAPARPPVRDVKGVTGHEPKPAPK